MSIIFTTVAYAMFAAWALASASAVGMWAWLTIIQNAGRERVCAPNCLTHPGRSAASRGGRQKVTA